MADPLLRVADEMEDVDGGHAPCDEAVNDVLGHLLVVHQAGELRAHGEETCEAMECGHQN